MTSMKPLKKNEMLNKRISNILKEMIIYNQIEPGTRMVIKDLCDKFQVSSSPVRDALRYLEAQGLVIYDGNGSFVLDLTKNDVEEIYDIRQVLEPYALENSFKYFNKKKLENLANKMSNSSSKKTSFADDMAFHGMIIESCTNGRLQRQLEVLANQSYHIGFRLFKKSISHKEINNEHYTVIQSILGNNVKEASRLLKIHLITSKERILKECF